MADLRAGEVLLEQCGGGSCAVCRGRIPPGPAVQLSKWTTRLRHVGCMPKTDKRLRYRTGRTGTRILPRPGGVPRED
jgi:ferredoxin